MQPVPITQLVLDLIAAVGVGNFILIVFVLFLLFNLPSIITTIIDTIKKNKVDGKLVAFFKEVIDCINVLNSKISDHQKDNHEENTLIVENLGKINDCLIVMEKRMRNVISESDTSKVLEFILGFRKSLLADIINKISEMSREKTGINTSEIKKDIESSWLSFKSDINELNTPINLKNYFEKYDILLWQEDGFFGPILIIVTSTEYDNFKKIEAISKHLDMTFRRIHSDLTSHMQAIKSLRSKTE
jgi:hypothetical protein